MSKTTWLGVQPSEDKEDGYKCLLESEYTADGTLIEGHDYRDVVYFHDLDTGRWYGVLKCERCGYPSVGWTEDTGLVKRDAQGYKYQQEVGG